MLKSGITPFSHQIEDSDFMASTPRCFNTSDPGTGKTLTTLMAFDKAIKMGTGTRLLVLAPLSILKPAWGKDIEEFTDFSFQIAHGSKRSSILQSKSKIIVTNLDAVKWLIEEDESVLKTFSHCAIDEFTAFNNRSSQRSKAAFKLAWKIAGLWLLSGTPTNTSITNIWHPAYMVDRGQRLGKSFWKFQSQVCEAHTTGPMGRYTEWRDREGVELEVADRLKDITIRRNFADCIDIPENTTRKILLDTPKWLTQKAKQLKNEFYIEDQNGAPLVFTQATARASKILQLYSGAIYDAEGVCQRFHTERTDLIASLILERPQSVVAYTWNHELEALKKALDKEKAPYGVINGSVSKTKREKYVSDFQAGKLRAIFLHPKSAAHGLTLTAGHATIWTSPNGNPEWFKQINARIARAGQTKKTETILIAYKDSPEELVYDRLDNRMNSLTDLLNWMQDFQNAA